MVASRIQTVQVTCINKPNRDSSLEAITHLGGNGWRWPRAHVIAAIEAGTYGFYTSVGGKQAKVEVREGRNGKYLQTHADGQWNNNLLSLPECR
jgi:hypothetical protein